MTDPSRDAYVRGLTRPHKNLMALYFVTALLTLPAFPIVLLALYFRYHTLRYAFDDEGVSVSWGLLFRQEVYLTYAKIQDIHVRRGLLERWLGIATVQVQTASGSASAEMELAGLEDYEAVRDFLYARMRGRREADEEPAAGAAGAPDEVTALLREVRDELRGVRAALSARPGPVPVAPPGGEA